MEILKLFVFLKDYDRCNPISQNKALNEWLKYCILRETQNNNNSGQNIQSLLEKIDEEQKHNKGIIDSVNNYAHFNKTLKFL